MEGHYFVVYINDLIQLCSGILLICLAVSFLSYNKVIKKSKSELKRLTELIDALERNKN